MFIFLMDFGAEQYVERKYGYSHGPSIEDVVTGERALTHQQLHSGDQDTRTFDRIAVTQAAKDNPSPDAEKGSSGISIDSNLEEKSFQQQICAFLILEFGVIFHSVIIGLNLGTAGDEFGTLYPVLVFHQSFEGLGIGARMSAIPFPKRVSWMPWCLCAGYGLTTPIAIAIGLGLRTTYNSGSFTANVVSGVLDAISAGILVYTGLVELLARDFLFNHELSHDKKRLTFMICSVLLGTAVMALLGKWA
ncbi:zinc-regulated transporter 1 protein [Rutstroemia sp. NJR-2017a BVV2]|nr:zinc-regulated transporter 1 protein [Rutstroemia sp. NJR-2017a BVV2]